MSKFIMDGVWAGFTPPPLHSARGGKNTLQGGKNRIVSNFAIESECVFNGIGWDFISIAVHYEEAINHH